MLGSGWGLGWGLGSGLGVMYLVGDFPRSCFPRGSIYTTVTEFGPQNHNGDGLLGLNSIIVVYMDPLGL